MLASKNTFAATVLPMKVRLPQRGKPLLRKFVTSYMYIGANSGRADHHARRPSTGQ